MGTLTGSRFRFSSSSLMACIMSSPTYFGSMPRGCWIQGTLSKAVKIIFRSTFIISGSSLGEVETISKYSKTCGPYRSDP